MATIKSHLVLQDGMSRALRGINTAMNLMISNLESAKQMGQSAFDSSQIDEMRSCIKESNSALDQMENNYRAIAGAETSAVSEQVSFNQQMRDGVSSADGLLKKVTSIAAAYMGFQKVKGLITDSIDAANTQITAEMQLGTVMSNMGMGDYYNDVISKAKSIQASGMYGDESMIAGAAELSTYFEDGKAVLSMMDTLKNYAAGMSGGAALDSTAMTDYATNIGKIMTGSFDAMTKKGFEFTDAQKAIIKGTATEQQIVQELGKEYLGLSHDMQAAATINNIIDESWAGLYDTLSNTPQGEMSQFNNLISDLKEQLGYYVYPAIKNIIEYVMSNKDSINQFVENLGKTLNFVVTVLGWILQGAINAYNFINDNWSQIGPIIEGIVGAYIGLKLAIEGVKAAQWLLNAAMSANPVGIIIGLIAVLIAVFIYLWETCDGFREFWAKMWADATKNAINAYNNTVVPVSNGIINAGLSVLQSTQGVAEGISNAYWDAAINVARAAASMAEKFKGLIDIYNSVSSKVGGTTIDTSVFSKVTAVLEYSKASSLNSIGSYYSKYYEGAQKAIDNINALSGAKAANDIAEYHQKLERNFDNSLSNFQRKNGGLATDDAFSGKTFETDYDPSKINALNADVMDGYVNTGYKAIKDFSVTGFLEDAMSSVTKYTNSLDYSHNGDGENPYEDGENPYENQLNSIGGNTSSIAESLSKTTEELKYLRDIAEREAINRFTTAEVKIDMSGMTNKIDGEQDIDGIISVFTDKFVEALETASEGVHV